LNNFKNYLNILKKIIFSFNQNNYYFYLLFTKIFYNCISNKNIFNKKNTKLFLFEKISQIFKIFQLLTNIFDLFVIYFLFLYLGKREKSQLLHTIFLNRSFPSAIIFVLITKLASYEAIVIKCFVSTI